MILVIGLRSVPHVGLPWHWLGFPLLVVSLWIGRRDTDPNWPKVLALLAYTVVVLWLTRIDGDTGDAHVLELALMLGVGIFVVPALAAEYWLREPLDYSWVHGRWSREMWLWFPTGFVLAFGILWVYFNLLTPTLHHSWPLPLRSDPNQPEALWRLFWGCNFVGFWDELAFINFVFALIQGFTYRQTRSLLYIVVLHLLIDSVLFYMIANRWYPGWGWHP